MSYFYETKEFSQQVEGLFSPCELKPTLRVCITEKCNLNCSYCHKEGMFSNYSEYLSNEELEFIAKVFRQQGFSKVKFTGGEPLLAKNLLDAVRVFKEIGFEDISILTNGTMLNEKTLRQLKEAGLDRLTISLDTLRNKVAKQLNNCDCIGKVMENISLARNFFEEVKINCVIIPGMNFPDEILEIANFCRDNKTTLKFLSRLSEESSHPLTAQAISILKLYKQVAKKQTNSDCFVPTTTYAFSDGTKVEVSDFRNDEYRKRIGQNQLCLDCSCQDQCVEGPYAVRVMPNGNIKPCIIREDNLITFRKINKSQAKLICLTGLASSGKSFFREISEKKFGIKNVYAGKILKEETVKRKKPLTYENVMAVSRQIHNEEGPLGVIAKSFEAIQKNLPNEKTIIVDSVRSVAEYEFLKQFFNTYLVGVICNKKERFKRAKKGDFKLTKKQLIERDNLEMGQLNEKPAFNVGHLLGHADYYISGESKKFEEEATEILKAILND